MPKSSSSLISCEACGIVHHQIPLKHGEQAYCRQCDSELYKQIDNSLSRVLVFSSTSLILFFLSLYFNFLSLQIGDRHSSITLLDAGLKLAKTGYWELGIIVFLTSVLIPFGVIIGLFYSVIGARFNHPLPARNLVMRLVKHMYPWSLVGVFMLGVLVAIVKLMDLAAISPGPSLFFFAALLFSMIAANSNLDDRLCWDDKNNATEEMIAKSPSDLFISCHACKLVFRASIEQKQCPRCNSRLHHRKPDSINRTWALLITAILLYIPANTLPIMTVTSLAKSEPDTILSGVIKLIEYDLWGLALLVFFASVMVPILKFASIAFLLISTQSASNWRPHDRTRLYRINEIIGSWSMLDIYLVAILVSLVRMDLFVSIDAGPGASFFGAVVVLTLLAAHSFDSRLIWDNCSRTEYNN